eukprot:SAG22_NODE_19343_length_276_cov_0.525424_1_plen_76_part_01
MSSDFQVAGQLYMYGRTAVHVNLASGRPRAREPLQPAACCLPEAGLGEASWKLLWERKTRPLPPPPFPACSRPRTP